MDLSVWPAQWRSWSEVHEIAHVAEQTGWHGLWLADHLMLDSGSDLPTEGDTSDAWVLLPALAAVTERLRLGSLVAPVTFRHPALLASAATTMAQVCGDRFVLGVGAGWQRNEHLAYGFDLGSRRERSDRLENACLLLRALLDDDRPHHAGLDLRADEPSRRPAPRSPVPLLVGGKGERRTLRTVALHADEWNGWCDADLFIKKREILGAHCEAIGRDPADVRCSVNTFIALSSDRAELDRMRQQAGSRPVLAGSIEQVLDQLARLRAAGVDEVVIADWNLDDWTSRRETIERLATELLPVLRDP